MCLHANIYNSNSDRLLYINHGHSIPFTIYIDIRISTHQIMVNWVELPYTNWPDYCAISQSTKVGMVQWKNICLSVKFKAMSKVIMNITNCKPIGSNRKIVIVHWMCPFKLQKGYTIIPIPTVFRIPYLIAS